VATRPPRLTRALAAIATVAIVLLWGAEPAAAHTHLVGSVPPEGSELDLAPTQVTVTFSEPVDASLTTAEVTGGDGSPIGLRAHLDPGDARVVILPLPTLADGVYRVAYRTHGAADLHEVTGSIVFGVGTAPTAAGGETATPARPAAVAGRAGARFGTGATAAAALLLWALPRLGLTADARRRARHGLRVAAALGLVAVVAGTGAGLVDQAAALGGTTGSTLWRVVTASQPGRDAVLALELVAILAVLVAVERPTARVGHALRLPTGLPGRPTWAEVGTGGALVGLAAVLSSSGHGGTGIPGPLDGAVHTVHLLAATTWVGGLLLLPLFVRWSALGWRVALSAVAPVAQGLVVATVATGLVLGGGRVATVTALLAPGYGRIVLAKTAAIAVAVALGLAVGRTARRPARRAEVVLAASLVVLGAWLAATPPAVGPRFDPLPPSAPTAWSGQAGDLAVQLSLSPNRPGPSWLTVDVHDTRRPAPAPITGVSITGADREIVAAVAAPRRDDTSRWDAGTVTLRAGTAPLVLTIARAGLPDVTTSVPWTVPARAPARQPTIVSDAPLRTPTDVAALVVAAPGAWLLLRRRHHHHPEVPDDHHRPADPGAVAAAPAMGPGDHHRAGRRRGARVRRASVAGPSR
jgi:copper transport protein